MEAAITEEEILLVIGSLQANKAPGEDGFAANFYKAFKDLLVPKLHHLYNQILADGKLPGSWKHTDIVTILKPHRDPLLPSSYCPISLINQDAKIFMAVLANRLKAIVPTYIHNDQTGFVPVRDIADNIRRTLNVILLGRGPSRPSSSVVIALDIEKAFDTVEPSYLIHLLKGMGFGTSFLRTIESLYSSSVAHLLINGQRSESVPLHRGTQQGCPLSHLLFDFCMEPLARRIRSNPGICGFRCKDIEHKVSLFADDLSTYRIP